MPYIYKIYNDLNDLIYIGKTEQTLEERWAKHLWSCKNDPRNVYLYNAMNKYGIEHFFIEPVEQCEVEELSTREIYWINYYNSFEHGYNLTTGGEGHSIYNKNEIFQLWQKGYSQKEIADQLNCERHTISRALKALNIDPAERTKFKSQNASKSIVMLDKDDFSIIKEFKSTAEGLRFLNVKNLNSGAAMISRACRNQKMSPYGYKWMFKTDYEKIKENKVNAKTG